MSGFDYRQGLTTCVWPGCSDRHLIVESEGHQSPLCRFHLCIAVRMDTIVTRTEVERMRVSIQEAQARRRAEAPAVVEDPPRESWVYFLKTSGYIKIGWTSDISKRMRSYPPGSQLLAALPGGRKEEAALHRRFAVHRTHGREWYPLAADLIRHIDQVVVEHGAPPSVDFAGRPVAVPRPHSSARTIRPKWSPTRVRS